MTAFDRIRSRPVAGERDLGAMYDLAAAFPDAALHLADLPWRFHAPTLDVPERTRLWEDPNGELLAWAVLSSWVCIDDVVRPGPYAGEVASAVLDWAVVRLREESIVAGEPRSFYASSRADDAARIALIERHGFVRDDWHYVRLARDLGDTIPVPSIPDGFSIRPLDGERDVEAYVVMHRTAFGTKRMTVEWRRATLRDPRYVPELDLVAVAPDGELAGFCVCWITPPLPSLGGARLAQVEPMGVQPDYRRLGLGRALLLEGSRRAQSLGAVRIDVDSGSYNEAALRAYESVGFRRLYEEHMFVRALP